MSGQTVRIAVELRIELHNNCVTNFSIRFASVPTPPGKNLKLKINVTNNSYAQVVIEVFFLSGIVKSHPGTEWPPTRSLSDRRDETESSPIIFIIISVRRENKVQ